jgi:beta-glucosidase
VAAEVRATAQRARIATTNPPAGVEARADACIVSAHVPMPGRPLVLSMRAALRLVAGLAAPAIVLAQLAGGSASGQPTVRSHPRILARLTSATTCPWTNDSESVATRVSQIEAAATVPDLADLLWLNSSSPVYQGFTPAMPALCLPMITEQDGVAGIHSTSAGADPTWSHETQLPSPIMDGAAADRSLATAYGQVIGSQAVSSGVDLVGSPATDIIRTSLGGRSSENYSEDPYLAEALAVPEVKAIASKGAAYYLKHFAAYNQETGRVVPGQDNDVVSQQALREVYFPAQSAVIQSSAPPAGIMCSYNAVNGTASCANTALLDTILRNQWHFSGFIRTDCLDTKVTYPWQAYVAAGVSQSKCDISDYGPPTMEADLTKSQLARLATPYLTALFEHNLVDDPHTGTPLQAVGQAVGYQTALRTDNEGTVMLRNQGDLLPIPKSDSVELVGVAGGEPDLIEGGSMRVAAPTDEPNDISARTAMQAVWGKRMNYVDITGIPASGSIVLGTETPTNAQIAAAAAEARRVDVAVVVVSKASHEDIDHANSTIGDAQTELVDAVAAANPNTVVVVNSGSAVYLGDIENKVKAILWNGYPGEAAGNSLVDILDGRANPSGHLPITWPATEAADQAVTRPVSFGGVNGNINYDDNNGDGVDVGYRWYEAHHVAVAYPFGYGLSYTSFSDTDLRIQSTSAGWVVSCNVTNTGHRAGATVTSLYISQPAGQTAGGLSNEPPEELRGFQRLKLKPGQTRQAVMVLTPGDLAHFNTADSTWIDAGGTYTVRVGDSSAHLPLQGGMNVPWRSLGIDSGPTP